MEVKAEGVNSRGIPRHQGAFNELEAGYGSEKSQVFDWVLWGKCSISLGGRYCWVGGIGKEWEEWANLRGDNLRGKVECLI